MIERARAQLQPASLRAHLLVMLLVATSAVWVAAAWWSYGDALHEAEELLDAQLAQSARLLMAQTRHELIEEGDEHLTAFDFLSGVVLHPYEQSLQFRIEDREGRTLLSTASPPPVLPQQTRGYSNAFIDGQGWRVLVIEDAPSGLRVEAAQSLAIRDELAQKVAMRLALPVLLVLPLLGVLIYLVVGRALQPLTGLARSVKTRTPSNLTPVEVRTLPREVQPLAEALNRLLDRLARALEGERRFTADASHELRTPLAAIQMQAQVALETPSDADRRHALEQVMAGTRRATALVEQLLRLARIDPLLGLPATSIIDLHALAARVIDEATSSAGAKALRMDPASDRAVAVEGDVELLGVALQNLVGNALRHGGSEISVGVARTNGRPRLWVADNGPGVAEDELAYLTERFHRGRGATGEGSGLGLAIVKRIAELHGAVLRLENRAEGGLRATLAWDD